MIQLTGLRVWAHPFMLAVVFGDSGFIRLFQWNPTASDRGEQTQQFALQWNIYWKKLFLICTRCTHNKKQQISHEILMTNKKRQVKWIFVIHLCIRFGHCFSISWISFDRTWFLSAIKQSKKFLLLLIALSTLQLRFLLCTKKKSSKREKTIPDLRI